jgi:hypothetical protein
MNVYYHTVEDYSVLYNIVVHSVIYEGWHLAYMRKIQPYVIKLVRELRQVGGFLRLPPPIKLTATI